MRSTVRCKCILLLTIVALPAVSFAEDLIQPPLLKSITLLSSQEQEQRDEVLTPEIHVYGVPPSDLVHTELQSYLGSPLTLERVLAIKQLAMQYFKKKDPSVTSVEVPDQDLSNGKLCLKPKKATAGHISYSDTRWFSKEKFQKNLPLQPGDKIDREALLNNAAWLNRNPFHNTDIIFSPGQQPNTTDVDFLTKDRFPLRFYAGADNTGIEVTEQTRLFAGVNWGNAFWMGDLLTFQFTGAPDLHRFVSYFGKYDSYLPCKHILSLFGGYATLHADIPGFRSEGQCAQGSIYYAIPLKPLYTPRIHEVSFGFDYKSLNSNLFFQDIFPVVAKTSQITELSATYIFQDVVRNHSILLKAEIHGSPVQWLPDQTRARYDELRPDAPVQFAYGKFSLGDVYQLPYSFSLSALVRGQGASAPLLPSEQFGLGGYATVRGYEENAFNVDNALCGNLEIRFRSHPGWKKNELDLIAFLDYGWGHNWNTPEGIPATQYLLGVGPGLRWRTGSWLIVRADYGFELHDVFQDNKFGRFHLGVVGSY